MNPAVDEFADRLWSSWLSRDPDVGLKAAGSAAGLVPRRSLVEADEAAGAARSLLARLDDLRPVVGPDPDATTTLDHAEWLLATWCDAPLRHQFEFPVTPYVCAERAEAIVKTLNAFEFSTRSDVGRYVELVRSYAEFVEQMFETVWTQSTYGVLVPAPAVTGAVTAVSAAQATIARSLHPDESRLREIGDSAVAELGRHVERVVRTRIRPAYERLLSYLDGDYRAQAPAEVGFGQYPGGEEYYRAAVRFWTTSSIDPDEIHRIGIEQVEQLMERLARCRSRPDFDPRAVAQAYAGNVDELDRLYTSIVDRVVPQLPRFFGVLPESPWQVRRLHPDLEPGMTFGYYSAPSSATTPGTYHYNGSCLAERSTAAAAALMAHEILPGHHLQVALQVENDRLPAFRREPVTYLNAFIEGWAEYAAGLGGEMGLYDDPVAELGRLDFELFFAQRLVVDTGMNARGWSLERARDYMRQTSTRSEVQIVSETLRYSTDLPGQALAYRLGHLALENMRDAAALSLGPDFDLREFHDEVLGQGALPLSVLSRHLGRWSQRVTGPSVEAG